MKHPSKIRLSRESAFSVEFEPSKLTKRFCRTDMTIYRHNHGHAMTMTLRQMIYLRNKLTREIDRQVNEELGELSERRRDDSR
jgi:hypothetical protein